MLPTPSEIETGSLTRLADRIRLEMGLHYPAGRRADLLRGLRVAVPEVGAADTGTLVHTLLHTAWTPRVKEVLAGALTVGETYFFRDRALFDLLSREVLPEKLLRARREGRPLRIWSAGCSTGEEPYSVAMVLEDLPFAHETFLLATDINPGFLEKASLGVYGEWSFRDAPPGLKARFFTRQGENRYALLPGIRRKVRFQLLNLAEDHYPSPLTHTTHFDLILCRNVLMYFDPAMAAGVLRRFQEALVEEGTLALGPSENLLAEDTGFRLEDHGGCLILVKPGLKAAARARPAPAPTAGEILHPAPAPAPLPPEPAMPAKPPDAGETVTPRERFEARLSAGAVDGAAAALGDLLSEGADGADEMARLARAMADQGRLKDALYWADQASAVRPDPSVEFLRAVILLEKDEAESAERLLRRVLLLDPGHIPARLELGNLASGRGDSGEAGRQFRTALAILKDLPEESVLPDSGGVAAGTLAGLVKTLFRESEAEHG